MIHDRGSQGFILQADTTKPDEIGNVVALFCSEQASWITGQVIYADGGSSLMNPEVPPEIQLG
jgi:enoyl-[acyl-carrier-protein] reductase (NADH)